MDIYIYISRLTFKRIEIHVISFISRRIGHSMPIVFPSIGINLKKRKKEMGPKELANCTMGGFKCNGQDRRLGKNEMWHEGVVVVSLTNNSRRERDVMYIVHERGPYLYIFIC